MTLYTVDLSSWDGSDINWPQARSSGITAACVKATEGGGPGYRYTNPDFAQQFDGAAAAGLPLVGAYHCLSSESVDQQISYFLQALGGRDRHPGFWAMLDVEPFEELTSRGLAPDWGHVHQFCNSWWSDRHVPLAAYLPHWVWHQFGSPDLTALQGSIALVSSDYPSSRVAPFHDLYPGDGGPGWSSYGGRSPDLWQYASTALVPGIRGGRGGCDVNAYRGSLAQLTYTLTGATSAVPTSTSSNGDDMITHWSNVQRGATGDAVRVAQGLLLARGLPVGSGNGQPDGSFGPTTEQSTRLLQGRYGIAVDGVFGPHTLACALYGRDLG